MLGSNAPADLSYHQEGSTILKYENIRKKNRHDRDRCGNQQPDQDDYRPIQNQPASIVLQGQPATTKSHRLIVSA